jgi:N-succinyldiaminopimelate aminotransferase
MPRHPKVSPSVASIPGSVYSALAHRLATYEGEVYPLHIGDTWMEPAVGCRMQDLTVEEYPGMHRYSSPQGLRGLLEAIAERMTLRTGLETKADSVLVAAGATGALGAVAGAIVEPGAEVLILAPYWPLISGIVRSFHGTPVPVPIIGSVESAAEAVEALDGLLTERTVALYLNTPNNPTGRTLPAPWLEAMTSWARTNGLWILADEVYEDYLYMGEHTYTRPLAPERTFSVHSFSKAFGMAGNRCGYVVGPPEVMHELRKVSTHTFYSTPTAAQLAALRALEGAGDRWIAEAREQYRELGTMAAERLRVPPPEGSTFLFLDVSSKLDERGLVGFLEDCVERGLFVAPGPSFGPYPHHIRVCFTSAEPEVVERGVEVLARVLYG